MGHIAHQRFIQRKPKYFSNRSSAGSSRDSQQTSVYQELQKQPGFPLSCLHLEPQSCNQGLEIPQTQAIIRQIPKAPKTELCTNRLLGPSHMSSLFNIKEVEEQLCRHSSQPHAPELHYVPQVCAEQLYLVQPERFGLGEGPYSPSTSNTGRDPSYGVAQSQSTWLWTTHNQEL